LAAARSVADHDLAYTSRTFETESVQADYDAQYREQPSGRHPGAAIHRTDGLADADLAPGTGMRASRQEEVRFRPSRTEPNLADSDSQGRPSRSVRRARNASATLTSPRQRDQASGQAVPTGWDEPVANSEQHVNELAVDRQVLYQVFAEMQSNPDEFYQRDYTPRTPAVNARLRARGLPPVGYETIITAYKDWSGRS
jgi:hypothetical protein